MDTKDYTVTDQAGPKVAGIVTEVGATLSLTEPQARGELASGAIVPKGKEKAGEPSAAETKRLADLQARARGADSAKAETEAAKPAETPQAAAPAANAGTAKAGA